MTTARACVLSAILGVGAWAGWATLAADTVAAQTPQPAAGGARQPGTYPLGPDSLPQDGVP